MFVVHGGRLFSLACLSRLPLWCESRGESISLLHFVCSYLLPDRSRSSKHKTMTIFMDVNPIWEEMFQLRDVTLDSLQHRVLEVILVVRDTRVIMRLLYRFGVEI